MQRPSGGIPSKINSKKPWMGTIKYKRTLSDRKAISPRETVGGHLISAQPRCREAEKNHINAKNMPLFNSYRLKVTYKCADAIGVGEAISRFPMFLRSVCNRLRISV